MENFNAEQRASFEKVDSAVNSGSGGFFLTGCGGTGKTHVAKVCYHHHCPSSNESCTDPRINPHLNPPCRLLSIPPEVGDK